MISVYGANITLEQLHEVEVKRPEFAGDRWCGFQHGELVDIIVDEIRSRSWKVNDMKFSLSQDQADLAGAFDISIPNLPQIPGQEYSLGFLTSNMQRTALKMVVGTTVRCCTNGMATGEIVLNLKHTNTNTDALCDEIGGAATRYFEKAREIPLLVERMRERTLNVAEASDLLMQAGHAKLMPWARIGQVDSEFRNPTFGEHGKGTSWALLNAFTYIVKAQNPMGQMDRMNRFRELLPLAEMPAAA